MAEIYTDNATDSRGEDILFSVGEFRDEEYIERTPDFPSTSSKFTELCGAVHQDSQTVHSHTSPSKERENVQHGSLPDAGKQYLALSPGGNDESYYGSPNPSLLHSDLTESSFPAFLPDELWTYSSLDGIKPLSDISDNGDGQLTDSTPSYSYWGKDRMTGNGAESADYNICFNALLTPPDSPQPPSRVTSSADFLNTVKACIAVAIRAVVVRLMKEECFGCHMLQ